MTKSADRHRREIPEILRAPLHTRLCGLAVVLLTTTAHADNFANVSYDAGTDEIVVTMTYRGTNPDHAFSLKWGRCKRPADGGAREIVAQVLDSQAQDLATQDFKKTTRFNLNDLRCRPAKLTLRTAPRFYYTLQIPARTIAAP